MKIKNQYMGLLVAAAFIGGVANAEDMYLNGVWEKGKTASLASPESWNTKQGAAGRAIGKDDILHIVDVSGYSSVDGDIVVKQLDLGRFLAAKSSIGSIAFNMSKTKPDKTDGSFTVDVNAPKSKTPAVAVVSNFETYSNVSGRPLQRQMLVLSGGKATFMNSANPNGLIWFYLNTQKSARTLPGFKGGMIFDCPVQISNPLAIKSNNIAFCEGMGFQVCSLTFLNQTLVGKKVGDKFKYNSFEVFPLPTFYFEPLMIINVGDQNHPRAQMATGDFKLSQGSAANVFGALSINGNLSMEMAATLNVKKGGKVEITSAKIDKFAEIKTQKLARINVDGELTVRNPKLNKEHTKLYDVQMHVGETGRLNVFGTGFQGQNGLIVERSLLSLKKGAKVYARNMVRLGEKSRLQLFGENQITANEPSNKRCRIVIAGKYTIVELHANQYFDSFAGAKFPAKLRLCEGANEVRFVNIDHNWNKGFVLEIEGFKNGVIKLDTDNPMIATNVKAEGWKNFRLENGFLTADKQ